VRIEDDEGKKGIYADDEKGIEIIVSKRVTWVKDVYVLESFFERRNVGRGSRLNDEGFFYYE